MILCSLLAARFFEPAGGAFADGGPGASAAQGARALPPTSVEAVIAAVEAYEARIPSLAWEQVAMLYPSDATGGKPPVSWRMSYAVVRDGRWSLSVQTPLMNERQSFRDGIVATKAFGSAFGRLREPSIEVHGGVISPWMLLAGAPTRLLPSPQMLRLSECLSSLKETEVDFSSAPLLLVRGYKLDSRVSNGWTQTEVVIDASKGYMPARITTRLEQTGEVLHELITTESVEVGGVWIPSEGRRRVGAEGTAAEADQGSDEARAQRRARCAALIASAGLDLTKHADRQKRYEILRSVYGAPPQTVQVDPPDRGQHLRAWNFRVLDDALATELLKPPFDEGDKVLDARTRETCFWRGGKLVKEDGTPVVLNAAAAKPAALESKPSSPPSKAPDTTPAPMPPAENAKP